MQHNLHYFKIKPHPGFGPGGGDVAIHIKLYKNCNIPTTTTVFGPGVVNFQPLPIHSHLPSIASLLSCIAIFNISVSLSSMYLTSRFSTRFNMDLSNVCMSTSTGFSYLRKSTFLQNVLKKF